MQSPPVLSPTELAVLEMLAEGSRTSEIAKHLSLEYRSVTEIIRIIKSRLNPASPEAIRELAHFYKIRKSPQ